MKWSIIQIVPFSFSWNIWPTQCFTFTYLNYIQSVYSIHSLLFNNWHKIDKVSVSIRIFSFHCYLKINKNQNKYFNWIWNFFLPDVLVLNLWPSHFLILNLILITLFHGHNGSYRLYTIIKWPKLAISKTLKVFVCFVRLLTLFKY